MRTGDLSIHRGSAVALLFGLLALAGCVAYEPYPAAPAYPAYYAAPAPAYYYYQPCCVSSFSFNYSHRDGGYYHHRHWR